MVNNLYLNGYVLWVCVCVSVHNAHGGIVSAVYVFNFILYAHLYLNFFFFFDAMDECVYGDDIVIS